MTIKPLEFTNVDSDHYKVSVPGYTFEVTKRPDETWIGTCWQASKGFSTLVGQSFFTTKEEAIDACNARWEEVLQPYFTEDTRTKEGEVTNGTTSK